MLCISINAEWERVSMKKAERMKIPRQAMPEQDPAIRVENFKEVPLGLTEEQAVLEASRCLQCKNPPCVKGCPVEVQIPAFIEMIREKQFGQAAKKIKETSALPAVCGRVCPQENQCEKYCVVAKVSQPIAIGFLERFAADYERENDLICAPEVPANKAGKIAVVGSGPAGLTVAGDLQLAGYQVTVFEALHLEGGVLVYGIPEFRLPKVIVRTEVDYLKQLGVEFKPNSVIGRLYEVKELLEDFDAVFIGVGAGLPRFMNLPGENLNGVFSANEYLTRSNLMKAYKFPNYDTPMPNAKKVAVFGGGNVAMDSARTARRYGADVDLIYRRSRKEMPARVEEVHHGEQEGINFRFLTNPLEYLGDEKGTIRALKLQKMELGEPDASGRRRPQPIEGSEYEEAYDLAIVAIGSDAQKIVPETTEGLELNKWGNINVDEDGMTSIPGVFAGGDIVTGSATVIEAMGAGKLAARSIQKFIADKK